MLVVLAAACSSRASPPSADSPPPPAPPLAGATVMVLPAQTPHGATPVAGLDEEIAYWLAERGPRVRWILPPAIDRALARNRMLDIEPRALAVEIFSVVEVRTIGDPLFGDLRRLGALVDARYALVPTAAAYVQSAAGPRIEIAAALIDTLGGRVLWYGIVAGESGTPGDAALAATAAEALARAIVR
jgi:hypothetical protein